MTLDGTATETHKVFSISDTFKKANDYIQKGCDKAGRKYSEIENSHPKLLNIVKKVLFFSLAAFALFTNPLVTGLGLIVGIVLAKEIKPLLDRVIKKCSNTFKEANWMIKALMIAGAAIAVIVTPGIALGAGIGVKAGSDARMMI